MKPRYFIAERLIAEARARKQMYQCSPRDLRRLRHLTHGQEPIDLVKAALVRGTTPIIIVTPPDRESYFYRRWVSRKEFEREYMTHPELAADRYHPDGTLRKEWR